ncbi:XkdQ/YqbQ family protein [Cohnella rhizosphaerae]|uniref:XkdQ/YqbQ family protein n=1 Tax=Cohnella rhizosphaerae TaxID=1457232 RepID=UPI0030B8A7BC
MSYEVVLDGKYYLGDLAEEITLEDSLEEIAYRANIRLTVRPGLPAIAPGQEIRISGVPHGSTGMAYLLHPALVWECESERSAGSGKHLNVTAYDRTLYLSKSEDERLMPDGQTAAERLASYASGWNIPLAALPDTGIKLKRSVKRSQSIFSMILEDLKETASKGGELYRPRMTPNGLTLVKLGGNDKVWQLESLESVSQKRTLEGGRHAGEGARQRGKRDEAVSGAGDRQRRDREIRHAAKGAAGLRHRDARPGAQGGGAAAAGLAGNDVGNRARYQSDPSRRFGRAGRAAPVRDIRPAPAGRAWTYAVGAGS